MIAELLVRGKIFTGDKSRPYAECLAVRDGEFVYVGSLLGAAGFVGPETVVREIPDGELILPAIQEGHAHVASSTQVVFELDLGKEHTIDGYCNAIREYIAQNPGRDRYYGRGFLNGVFPAGTPTKDLLDAISTELLLFMESEDGHTIWVNSRVLAFCGIGKDTPDVRAGVIERDAAGEPIGCFREMACELLKPAEAVYTKEHFKEAILYYQEMAFRYGISNVFEPMGPDIDVKMSAYRELIRENKLRVHTTVGPYIYAEDDWRERLTAFAAYREEIRSDLFKIDTVKIFVDGVIEGHTAYLLDDYSDTPGDRGESMWEDNALVALFSEAQRQGFSIHVHAIGDAAIAQTLDAFDAASRATGIVDSRNTITHVQLLAPEDFRRFHDLHIIADVNPYWHYRQPFYYEELELPFLGPERAGREYPIRSFLDAGVLTTIASDWPVSVPCNPWKGMEMSVTRQAAGDRRMTPLNPEERITAEEALYCLTVNGAYQNHLEDRFGSITPGKQADFLRIDRDVLTIEPHSIHETKVLEHYVRGQISP